MPRGLDNAAIGVKSVPNHVSNIVDKLDVNNRGQAIVRAREAGFGTRDEAG